VHNNEQKVMTLALAKMALRRVEEESSADESENWLRDQTMIGGVSDHE
jgi:hypothetical protein